MIADAGDAGAADAVRLTRRIPAPPAEVYQAWLDPDLIRRWLAPAGLWVSRAEVEARVGGRHRVWNADGHGFAGGSEAEILELVPGERLVFRWQFVGADRLADPAQDSRLTITFDPTPDGHTDLTLVHERLAALAAAHPDIVEGVRGGWAAALDNLVAEPDQLFRTETSTGPSSGTEHRPQSPTDPPDRPA